MFIDATDNPHLTVYLLRIEAADIGALEEPAEAIAISVEVVSRGEFVVYGLRLSDRSAAECSLGPVPVAALSAAKRVTRDWINGELIVPFFGRRLVSG